jgi:hypothetical protein
LIRVQAENFKKVRVLDIAPNRYVTKISGANEAGKTSALDAIFYGLQGRKTLPKELIHRGQKKGAIFIETTTHLITRQLDDKGGSLQIEVKATGNLLKEPGDWLEEIAGSLGFDPLSFMRMKAEEQFQTLKKLVPLEADVDDLAIRNETDLETITRRKAEAKRLEAARSQITIDKALPEKPTDVDALLKQSREAADFNADLERQRVARENAIAHHAEHKKTLEDMSQRHKRLTAELAQLAREMEDGQAIYDKRAEAIKGQKPLPEPRDRSAIDAQISAADSRNQAITINNANKAQATKLEGDADAIKVELEELADQVRNRKLAIAKALDSAKFPVDGLSFETQEEGSGGRERKNPKKIITYKGLPLSDASTAEQIRVSTAIGMAGKPELRFLLIRDGSLLDDKNLAVLEEMAHEHSFQILMEVVDTTGKVGIYMEEGAVKTVNAEEEAPPAAVPAKPKRKKKEAASA